MGQNPSSGEQTSADPVVVPPPSQNGDAILALHNPKPTACIGCHEAKRLNATHYPGKDCVSCHTYPSFKGAFFAHATQFTYAHSKPSPEACLPCHFREGNGEHRNDGRAMLTGFGNCFNCHRNFDKNVERNWDRQ